MTKYSCNQCCLDDDGGVPCLLMIPSLPKGEELPLPAVCPYYGSLADACWVELPNVLNKYIED